MSYSTLLYSALYPNPTLPYPQPYPTLPILTLSLFLPYPIPRPTLPYPIPYPT